MANQVSNGQQEQAMVLGGGGVMRTILQPTNAGEAYKMANVLSKAFGQPEAIVFAKIVAGAELGLTALQAYRGVHIIEGQPALSANLKEALCLANMREKGTGRVVDVFEMRDLSDEKCTYYAKRVGRPGREYTFTIEDARAALLVDRGTDPSKNNWNKWRTRMLAARAKSMAADMEFQDILLGFPTTEDIEDERQVMRVPAQPTGVGVAASPAPPKSDKVVDAEVVQEEAKAATVVESAEVADASPVDAAIRDYEDECMVILESIAIATDGKAVRQTVQKFLAEAPANFADPVREAYNAKFAKKRPEQKDAAQ